MRRFLLHEILLVSVAMLVYQAGCSEWYKHAATGRQEILDSREIDKITILPIADGRRQINKKVDFEKATSKVQEQIIACLKEKGYDCVAITDTTAIAIDPKQIPFADATHIAEIGPDEARWVMVPIVERLDIPYISSYFSLMYCYLFDKEIGQLVWECSASYYAIYKSGFHMHVTVQTLMEKFPEKSR